MDSLTFTVTAPSYREGDSVTYPLLAFRKGPPVIRRKLIPITGLGTQVCYMGPGDQMLMARIILNDEDDWSDFDDKYLEIISLEGTTGELEIEGDTDEPVKVRRKDEEHENVLINAVVPLRDIAASPGEFSQEFMLQMTKLRTVGGV